MWLSVCFSGFLPVFRPVCAALRTSMFICFSPIIKCICPPLSRPLYWKCISIHIFFLSSWSISVFSNYCSSFLFHPVLHIGISLSLFLSLSLFSPFSLSLLSLSLSSLSFSLSLSLSLFSLLSLLSLSYPSFILPYLYLSLCASCLRCFSIRECQTYICSKSFISPLWTKHYQW